MELRAIVTIAIAAITNTTVTIGFAIAAAILGGCAQNLSSLDRVLATPGIKSAERTEIFDHFVVEHLAASESRTLHVYIEGDGLPWQDRFTIAQDPTPHNALAMSLMLQDAENSIYIGRPCYFSQHIKNIGKKCESRYWTSERYAPEIIESMRRAIDFYRHTLHADHIALIGYSGGAVIATELADLIDGPVDLITLAGNLNVAAWTALHGYTPLQGSRDPFIDFTPKPTIRHHHFAAAADKIVPPSITASFTDKYRVDLTIVPAADHGCCWNKIWPDLLRGITSE